MKMINKTNDLFVTIIMPALNEEKNILSAIDDTLSAFEEFNVKGEIMVINDGSTDSTPSIVKSKMGKHSDTIRMITHDTPKGIGTSFWNGVDNAKGNVVCMLPGDNENEPREILRYLYLLRDVDIVIPFVFDKESRSSFRNIVSAIYNFIINNTFLVALNYTNGTVLYRKSLLDEIDYRTSGFFYQTDILIRLVKRGYLFAEVPYRLKARMAGKSKAFSFRSIWEVTKGYFRLIKNIYFKKEKKIKVFNSNSISAKRYQELDEKLSRVTEAHGRTNT